MSPHALLRLLVPVVFAAVALGGAACGEEDDATPPPRPAATSPTATTEEEGGGVTVTMQDNVFSPGQASVKVGETVTFKNAGQVAHNAVGGELKSDTVDPGGTFEFTPTKAGTISYVCTFHAGMTGSLTVES